MQCPAHRLWNLEFAEQKNEGESHPKRDQTTDEHDQPNVHSVPPGDFLPSKIVPTTMPVRAARINPNLNGIL